MVTIVRRNIIFVGDLRGNLVHDLGGRVFQRVLQVVLEVAEELPGPSLHHIQQPSAVIGIHICGQRTDCQSESRGKQTQHTHTEDGSRDTQLEETSTLTFCQQKTHFCFPWRWFFHLYDTCWIIVMLQFQTGDFIWLQWSTYSMSHCTTRQVHTCVGVKEWLTGTQETQNKMNTIWTSVCVCVRACMRACVRACMCVCVCVRVLTVKKREMLE